MMASAMRSIRALGRTVRLPSRERREVFVAAIFLAYANLALKLLPSKECITVELARCGHSRN